MAMASRVLLEPVPAMTGTRPREKGAPTGYDILENPFGLAPSPFVMLAFSKLHEEQKLLRGLLPTGDLSSRFRVGLNLRVGLADGSQSSPDPHPHRFPNFHRRPAPWPPARG